MLTELSLLTLCKYYFKTKFREKQIHGSAYFCLT
eukprot:UN26956